MSIQISAVGPVLNVVVTDVLRSADIPMLLDAMRTQARHGQFVVVTDTIGMHSAPRPVLMEFVEGMKRNPLGKDVWLADAVVVNSPLTRFVLSTLLMIAPMPTEVKAFDTRADADRWIGDILRKARLMVPLQTA